MADKFRKVFPIGVDLGDGELPSSEKLNAISTQARNGLALVELGLGDPWGQAGDTALSNFPLQIPNLARMAGENKLLNPAIYPTSSDFVYTEDLSNKWQGETEGYLQFKPKGSIAIDVDQDGIFSAGPVKTNDYDVTSSGQYWFNANTGKFKLATPIRSGNTQLSYTVGTTDEWLAIDNLPGVIPDPRERTFFGLRFENTAGLWYIHLPPRGPLDFTDLREMPAVYPLGTEYSNNYASSTSGDKKLWQDPTLNAFTGSDAIHYRYSLPKELTDQWASLSSGQRLPDGYLYLWNQQTKAIVEGVIFYKTDDSPSLSYRLRIDIGTLDTTDLATTNDSAASYNSGYSLVTAGASLARTAWQQSIQFLAHEHDNSGDLAPAIAHSSLAGLNPPTAEGSEHSARYPSSLNSWKPSRWNNDDHISLLSRAGSQSDGARERDGNNNAMLGDLILASSVIQDVATGSFLDSLNDSDSNKIHFGDIGGPYLYVKGTGGSGAQSIYAIGPDEDANGYTGIGLRVSGGQKISTGGVGGRGFTTTGGAGVGSTAWGGDGLDALGGDGDGQGGRGIQALGGDSITATGGTGVEATGGDGVVGGVGVKGTGGSPGGGGVQGIGTGTAHGVYGSSSSITMAGIFGVNTGSGYGAYLSTSGSVAACRGLNSGSGPGIEGSSVSGRGGKFVGGVEADEYYFDSAKTITISTNIFSALDAGAGFTVQYDDNSPIVPSAIELQGSIVIPLAYPVGTLTQILVYIYNEPGFNSESGSLEVRLVSRGVGDIFEANNDPVDSTIHATATEAVDDNRTMTINLSLALQASRFYSLAIGYDSFPSGATRSSVRGISSTISITSPRRSDFIG